MSINADEQGNKAHGQPNVLRYALVSILVGAIVACTACVGAWVSYRGLVAHARGAWINVVRLQSLDEAIVKFQNQSGALPKDLADLAEDEEVGSWVKDEGVVLDKWKNPIAYSTDGNSYELLSYGRDGVVGGAGYDHDIRSTTPHDMLMPTFAQFMADSYSMRMTAVCGVTGILAGICCFVQGRRRKQELRQDTIRVLVTVGASVVLAIGLAFFHAPLGH